MDIYGQNPHWFQTDTAKVTGEERLRSRNASFTVAVLAVFLLTLILPVFHVACLDSDEEVWYIHDVIEPSLDEVKWFEEGGIAEPPAWISDGSWYAASMRESLVAASDIFVETYEYFNWTLVKPIVDYYYDTTFGTFDDFASFVSANPGQWLDLSWQIDTGWYGVSQNSTKVKYSYDEASSDAELWVWFHITHIPEYFTGEGKLESWLTGFDLTPVSTGNLKVWELHKDWSKSGISYNLRFRAPASLLFQHGDNFTLSIGVSPDYRGQNFTIQQAIDIDMPANTEIKEALPSNMSLLRGNTATFVLPRNTRYPAAFTVVSGPPSKSFSQVVWENASLWLFTPAGWAAIASLLVLSFTGLRGRRIWNRSRLYHRLFKSMVTVYDMYSKDLLKFHQEMDNMSKSIIKTFVEDKITDDQFEKLLQRRDDLLARVRE
jgi:hypothetical protein